MQMLDQPDSNWSPGLFEHLDRCLMCHACEAMCPSDVPYARLMDAARARIEPRRRRSAAARLARTAGFALLTSGRGRRVTSALLRLARLLGGPRLAGLPGLPGGARRLLRLIPAAPPASKPQPGPAARRGRVNLFSGCTGELLDGATLQATRRLLHRLGYEVVAPAQQVCCGALHQHGGRPRAAEALASANCAAFSGNDDPIISFASGCCAQLLGYGVKGPDGAALAGRVSDIVTFIDEQPDHALRFKAFDEKVALHIPCTQRNLLGQDALMRVLRRIPDIDVSLVNPAGGCCGAAGSYMLEQVELADRLGESMAQRVLATGAHTLLTTNIGCSLHLAAAVRQRGVQVLHPVALLERLAY